MTIHKRQSDLGKAKGYGSLKSGSHHWSLQRMTALILVVLGGWFFYGMQNHDLLTYKEAVKWLQDPISVSLMIMTLLVGFYHSILGLQVVIEDYIHNEGLKFITLLLIKSIFTFLFFAATYALVKVQSMPPAELI